MPIGPKICQTRKEIPQDAKEVDAFSSGLKELFFVKHPHYKKGTPHAETELKEFLNQNKLESVWVYYPSTNVAVKSLPEAEYFRLRTARNRDLISSEEQDNYRNIITGIAGLSVGSSILSALVISGGPKKIKIADFDNIEISNLNRIRAGLADTGSKKIEVAAREVWNVDPFAELILYPEGVKKDTLEEFLVGKEKLEVFIDAMDSIDLKIIARLICKKHGIPVLMATDNGDSIILDVERFDLEPDREIFHGLIEGIENLDTNINDYKTWLKIAAQIVGPEYLTESMQESVLKIGKSLANVPQLGTTAAVGGAVCSFVIRRIANQQPLDSGRYIISIEEKLVPEFFNKKNIEKRKIKLEEFKLSFGKK